MDQAGDQAYLVKLITKWRRAAAELEAKLGRPATTTEMAKHLKITKKKADIIRQGLQAVNAPSQMGADETQALSEMLPDDNTATPAEALDQAHTAPFIRAILTRLDERSRKILELRFGLDGWDGPGRTYKEIGKVIGLTRERVRQLEKKALAELNEIVEDL